MFAKYCFVTCIKPSVLPFGRRWWTGSTSLLFWMSLCSHSSICVSFYVKHSVFSFYLFDELVIRISLSFPIHQPFFHIFLCFLIFKSFLTGQPFSTFVENFNHILYRIVPSGKFVWDSIYQAAIPIFQLRQLIFNSIKFFLWPFVVLFSCFRAVNRTFQILRQ